MKTIIGAIALLIAAPAAAQTATATDPHAGHAQHQQGQHGGQDHSQHQQGQHSDHKSMDCCKDGKCCKKMSQQGKKMACCEHGEQKAGAHGDHGGH